MFSVVINTRNEIRHIAGCIASVRALADEIVVCDMHSNDGTAATARHLGARVIEHPVCKFVEPARYAAISAARGDWVLVIDADERLTPSLATRLRQITAEGRHSAVGIASLTQFAGRWLQHGPSGHIRTVRCFRRQAYFACYDQREMQIHENFKSLRRLPDLVELDLTTPLLHLAYPSLAGLVMKQAQYAGEDALKRYNNGERGSTLRLFRRVLERARKALIRQQAWKDGLAGWVFTAVMCLYEAASALKLMELQANGDRAAAAFAQPRAGHSEVEFSAGSLAGPATLRTRPGALPPAVAGLPTITPG